MLVRHGVRPRRAAGNMFLPPAMHMGVAFPEGAEQSIIDGKEVGEGAVRGGIPDATDRFKAIDLRAGRCVTAGAQHGECKQDWTGSPPSWWDLHHEAQYREAHSPRQCTCLCRCCGRWCCFWAPSHLPRAKHGCWPHCQTCWCGGSVGLRCVGRRRTRASCGTSSGELCMTSGRFSPAKLGQALACESFWPPEELARCRSLGCTCPREAGTVLGSLRPKELAVRH